MLKCQVTLNTYKYPESVEEHERDALLNQLSALLPTLQQDPTPVTNLIQVLISPSHQYDFSRVLAIQPAVDFLVGLNSTLPPINLTVLALLEKAKYHTSDIGIVAAEPEVVGGLIRLWLCSPDTTVAARAHGVLLALLLADVYSSSVEDGSLITDRCLLWRRIFRDRDIYGSIFSLCSLSTAERDGQPSKRDKTVAQARLLDMLLCIDSEPVRYSQIREIEEGFGVKDGGGLLHFAAIHMVDYRDDVLMHVTLMDFYAKYLSREHAVISKSRLETLEPPEAPVYPLQFLQECSIHKRTMSYYVSPDAYDSFDLAYLYGASANYLSVYCSVYSEDVLSRQEIMDSILARLTNVLQSLSSGQWAQGKTPKHDLHVLASLPRVALIPRNRDPPLFLVPPKSASPDTFNTLARIFHGNQGSLAQTFRIAETETGSARALYFLYMEHYPSFWTQVVSAAETVAIKDVALAALSLMGAIISAQWKSLPDTPSGSSFFTLPTERELTEKCHLDGVQLPRNGIETVMSEPAIGIVVPYLMKPAQTFSSLVGGGRGDVESAAYRVAAAKYDVLVLLHQKLKEWVGAHSDAQEMVATVGRRVAQGPMGGTTDIGGRVGTLDL